MENKKRIHNILDKLNRNEITEEKVVELILNSSE
jgi:hypothetical protein